MGHMNTDDPFYNARLRRHAKYALVQRYGPKRVMFSDVQAISQIPGTANPIYVKV